MRTTLERRQHVVGKRSVEIGRHAERPTIGTKYRSPSRIAYGDEPCDGLPGPGDDDLATPSHPSEEPGEVRLRFVNVHGLHDGRVD